MNYDEKLLNILNFLTTDLFWGPILDFVLSKCEPFVSETNTFEQYLIFLEYRNLANQIFEKSLFDEVKIKPDDLENIVMIGLSKKIRTAEKIVEHLRPMLDFNFFKEEMREHNSRIEAEFAQVVKNKLNAIGENCQVDNILVDENNKCEQPFQIGTSFHSIINNKERSSHFTIKQPSAEKIYSVHAPRVVNRIHYPLHRSLISPRFNISSSFNKKSLGENNSEITSGIGSQLPHVSPRIGLNDQTSVNECLPPLKIRKSPRTQVLNYVRSPRIQLHAEN